MNQLDRIYGTLTESRECPSPHRTFLIDTPSFKPPIMPVICNKWTVEQSPERLVRTFVFDNFDDFIEFTNEVLAYERVALHNATLTINSNTVRIEVYTIGPNCVTELDVEYRNAIDAINEMLFNVVS